MMILSLRLARNILNGNTANRLYVMKMGYVPLMLTQLGYALKVAPTLTEVFSDNEMLLERVDEQTIMVFIDLIKNTGREARYVDFLVTLCRANGKAVRPNQWKVCDLLVKARPELLVPLSLETVGGREVVMVRGDKRYFPKLAEPMPLCQWLDTTDKVLKEYFERVLFLYGLLVAGRNLKNTPVVRELLQYPLLLHIIRDMEMRKNHLNICAAFVSIIRLLYVDSMPHERMTYVQTVRIWDNVANEASAQQLTSRLTNVLQVARRALCACPLRLPPFACAPRATCRTLSHAPPPGRAPSPPDRLSTRQRTHRVSPTALRSNGISSSNSSARSRSLSPTTTSTSSPRASPRTA